MFQTIGAYLDIALYVGMGLFLRARAPLLVRQQGTDEAIAKRAKLMRTFGTIMAIGGVAMLMIRLFVP